MDHKSPPLALRPLVHAQTYCELLKAIPMPNVDRGMNRLIRRKIKDLKNKLTFRKQLSVNVGCRCRKQSYLPLTTPSGAHLAKNSPARNEWLHPARKAEFDIAAKLLIEKGLITRAEFMRKISASA